MRRARLPPGYRLAPATGGRRLRDARRLFREYAAAFAGVECFSGFPREVAGLPGDYAPPGGRLLLLYKTSVPAGCVALRPAPRGAAELKRLFVRHSHRGLGLGELLTRAALAEARRLGARRVILDTLPAMKDAIALYRRLGFRKARARPHLAADALFFSLRLR